MNVTVFPYLTRRKMCDWVIAVSKVFYKGGLAHAPLLSYSL